MSMNNIHGSRKLILLAIVVACLIITILLTTACGSPEASARVACIEIMRKVPAGYQDFEFWDAGTLRKNDDLAGMYETWMERRGGYRDIISGGDIEYWAAGGVLTMVTGDLSLRDIRNDLSKYYYRYTDYPDSEVWLLKPELDSHGLIGSFILEEDLVVRGNRYNIEDYLGVAGGDEPSFYSDDVADVIEEIPAGIMTRISVTTVSGLRSVTVMSVEIEGKGIYRWTSVTTFLDTGDIANHLVEVYMESIESDFRRAENIYKERNEPSPFRDFTLERDGTHLKWSVIVDEDEMIALLFYG
jgi:hypothetical protein